MATKRCPFCLETIQYEAIVCKHCGRDLSPTELTKAVKKGSRLGWKAIKWIGIYVSISGIVNAIRIIIEGTQILEPNRPTTGVPWGDLVADLFAALVIALVGYALFRWGSGKEQQTGQHLENEEDLHGEGPE